MNVTELIKNFQAALADLASAAERVRIPWRRPDAYDEWDSLATAAYNCLVVTPCCWSQPTAEQAAFRLPPYDLLLESYAGYSVIEVGPDSPPGIIQVFHALGTTHEPFDTIEWRSVDFSGRPRSEDLRTCPLHDARLALRVPRADGTVLRIWDLEGDGLTRMQGDASPGAQAETNLRSLLPSLLAPLPRNQQLRFEEAALAEALRMNIQQAAAHRDMVTESPDGSEYVVIKRSDVDILGETLRLVAPLTAGPLAALAASLWILLWEYRRKGVRLPPEDGLLLMTLRQAPQSGWTADDVRTALAPYLNWERTTIEHRLRHLTHFVDELRREVALVSERAGRWRALDPSTLPG